MTASRLRARHGRPRGARPAGRPGPVPLLVLVDLSLRSSRRGSIREGPAAESGSLAGLLVAWSRRSPRSPRGPGSPSRVIGVLPSSTWWRSGPLRLSPEASGTGILTIVPALWLVCQFGRRGAIVMAIAAAACWVLRRPLLRARRPVVCPGRALELVAVLAGGSLGAAHDRAGQRGGGRPQVPGLRTGSSAGHTRAFADAILDTVDVGLVLLAEAARTSP